MSEPKPPKFAAQFDSDARRTPVRVAFVTRRTSPQVKAQDDAVVMTFPEGLFRGAVAIEILAIVLVVISLIWDAPLEQLADPMRTPNPAKAPWYFLGLQELLHYFPPLVAGVVIPTMVMLAFHVYAVLIPSLMIGGLMLLAAGSSPTSPARFRRWLVAKPLSFWIMTWFLVEAGILTAIGTFFRGAGWSWVWPWS